MKEVQLPDEIKPFHCHGVELRKGAGQSADWVGDCPFCGKRDHFFVSPKKGTWDCKVCSESGNAVTFLGKLAKQAAAETVRVKLAELSKQRGLPAGILRDASVGFRDGQWLVPCFSEKGTVRDIRRYDGKKMMSTAGCKSQLWGADRLAAAPEGSLVILCEGEWDGMAGRWLLRDAAQEGVVVAVPGATVFKPEWASLFRGKRVVTVYDHDDAGDRGQIKAEKALRDVASELTHVCWPESMPDGFDLRDFARKRVPEVGAEKALEELMGLAADAPRREVGDGSDEHPGASASSKFKDSDLPDGVTFEDVLEAFKARLLIDSEFEMAIKFCCAVAFSNDIKSAPVWAYLMGPAGIGKTELLTSMIGSSRAVFRSTVTPKCLVSGFRGEGDKDPSLIPKLKGKTLIAKDFTEVLSLPDVQQKEIYSTLRGAFDGFVDKTFGNGMERHYKDCYFSVLAGVTTAILKHRESAMGERFLKFRLSNPTPKMVDDQMDAALDSIGKEAESGKNLQKVVAAFLKVKLPSIDLLPTIPLQGKARDHLKAAAKMIASMRTQVERDQRLNDPQYKPTPESPNRVIKQLGTIARILAWINGSDEVGEGDELEVISKIAFDTVCGFDSDIVDAIMSMGARATRKDISSVCGIPSTTVSRRLEDMLMVGVVRMSGQSEPGQAGGRPSAVYEVREDLAALWRQMKGGKQWQEGTSTSRSQSAEAGESSKSRSSSGSSARPNPSGSPKRRLVRRRTTIS